MDAKTYLKISAINLGFLSVGILIGIAFMNGVMAVHAQANQVQTKDSSQTKDSATTKVERAPVACDDVNFECVSPGLSTGTAAFGIVLAGKVASDQLIVNGFEPLKLHDATLAALQSKGVLNAADVKAIVDAGKAKRPPRFR